MATSCCSARAAVAEALASDGDGGAGQFLAGQHAGNRLPSDSSEHLPQIGKKRAEPGRRELLRGRIRDHFAEFLLELARKGVGEFTGGGRGVRRVAACNDVVVKHLRCTSSSSANSRFLPRIEFTPGSNMLIKMRILVTVCVAALLFALYVWCSTGLVPELGVPAPVVPVPDPRPSWREAPSDASSRFDVEDVGDRKKPQSGVAPAPIHPLVDGRVLDLGGVPVIGVEVGLLEGGSGAAECVRTDLSGRFQMRVGGDRVSIIDPRFVLVARSSVPVDGCWVLIVSHVVPVDGYVVDSTGGIVSTASVRYGVERGVVCAATPNQGVLRLSPPQVATISLEGRFVLSGAPEKGLISITAPGYMSETVRVDREGGRGMTIVLRELSAGGGCLSGCVISSSQQCIASALVGFGQTVVETDARGVFAVLRNDVEASAGRLTFWVMAPGYVSRQCQCDIGPEGDLGTVVLDKGELSLAGRVEDQLGRPVAWATVAILDPSRFGNVPTSMGYLASTYVEGDGRPTASCDEQGRFSLAGVVDRPYQVVAVCPETLACASVSGAMPIEGEIVLTIDKAEVGKVSGRVVGLLGRAVSDAKVTVVRRVENVDDGLLLGVVSGASAITDESGYFLCRGVCAGDLCLRVSGGVLPRDVVLTQGARNGLIIVVESELSLRIRPRSAAIIVAVNSQGVECDMLVRQDGLSRSVKKLGVDGDVSISVGESVVGLRVMRAGREEVVPLPVAQPGELVTLDV